MTHEEAIELHAEHRARLSYSPYTITLERGALRALLRQLGKPLADIGSLDVRALFAKRAPQVANDTAARELGTLRAFFTRLVEEGGLAANPTDGFSLPYTGIRAAPPLVLTEEAVQKLLLGASVEPQCLRSKEIRRALALRNRAALELLYGLGIRAAELHAALVVDLDFGQEAMLVRRVKRGEPRLLPLPPSVLPHLTDYLKRGRPHLARSGQDHGRLFVTERGTPLRPLQLGRVVNLAARNAGLRAHPHAFRRSLASHLVARGVSLVAVQKLLGHVSLATTERYVFVDRAALHLAVEALDQVRDPLSEGGVLRSSNSPQ